MKKKYLHKFHHTQIIIVQVVAHIICVIHLLEYLNLIYEQANRVTYISYRLNNGCQHFLETAG